MIFNLAIFGVFVFILSPCLGYTFGYFRGLKEGKRRGELEAMTGGILKNLSLGNLKDYLPKLEGQEAWSDTRGEKGNEDAQI
jgi:hypothetical protein